MTSPRLLRRDALKMFAGAVAAPSLAQSSSTAAPTQFQLACMTLPYANFPLDRALEGIASAGYRYVAWGTTHQNSPGRKESVIAADAPAAEARRLAGHCRSMGLEPVMMFSEIYVAAPESVRVHTKRIEQAAAAGMPFVLTFGAVLAGQHEPWIRNLRELGPMARDNGVTIVIKQHGGNTALAREPRVYFVETALHRAVRVQALFPEAHSCAAARRGSPPTASSRIGGAHRRRRARGRPLAAPVERVTSRGHSALAW